tara:strand:+ start:837 stop:3692 length:2856 start_codon:yes stop_codon:yes gene_type:complete
MNNKRAILTIHKLVEQRDIDLFDAIKKHLFHSEKSVVISALRVLGNSQVEGVHVELQSLYKNSPDDVKAKILDFIRINPDTVYSSMLENCYRSEKSDILRMKVLLAAGSVARLEPDLLQFIRGKSGYEESRLDVRSQAIEALAIAQDFEHLLSLWQDFSKIEDDELFACQVLRCLVGLKDEAKFVELYDHSRHVTQPLGELSVALHQAMFEIYSPGVKSQPSYAKICEKLISLSRSSDNLEQRFVLNTLEAIKEGHDGFLVKIINSLLLVANNDPELKSQRRKLIHDRIIHLSQSTDSRKGLSSTLERLMLNARKTLEDKLRNRAKKIGDVPRKDFVEFFESVGNSNLLTVVIQFLKTNPPQEQRRNLLLSILKKLQPSLNLRQKKLLSPVIKLIMSEDVRTRSSLAIECGKIKFEDSTDNLSDNISFLVSIAPDVFSDRCCKILIPIYELVFNMDDDGKLAREILRALVKNGSVQGLQFVFEQLPNLMPTQQLELFTQLPNIEADHISFAKSKISTKSSYSPEFLEVYILLLEKMPEIRDSEWVRILFQMQKLRYGSLSEGLIHRVRKLLLSSGSVAALDAFHTDLKTLDYVLSANLVELILSAYVGFRLDEESQNKEILSDLLYGCLKETNQEFMCDIGYVLHQLNEKQGSVILQQSLDSENESEVAKAVSYFAMAGLWSNWRSIFKVLEIESFRVHQQFLSFFDHAECAVQNPELQDELIFQLTGERLSNVNEALKITDDEELERLEGLFQQMRSNRMDNKIRYQMEQSMQELTVFFIDIAGYTERSRDTDIAEIMLLLDNFAKIIQPIGEKFSGNLVKKIGDCFMYTFEQPIDGVLASLEIQKKLQEYNQKRVESEQLHTRIGLNTGKVFMKEGDVFGDPVNMASRIESKAPHDGILIHESTFVDVKDFVEYQKMDPILVKGADEPVQTYLILDSLPGVLEMYFKTN